MRKKSGGKGTAVRYLLILVGAALLLPACEHHQGSGGATIFSSRSYKGHASDADINNFVRVYPATVGTRLDDCQTCHTGGDVIMTQKDGGDAPVFVNPCNFCHYIPFPPVLTGDSVQDYPTTYAQTLNPYGTDYMGAGRDQGAVRDIKDLDSDGDGFSNHDEIHELRYPGDPNSQPGQEICSYLTVTLSQLKGMTAHRQFGLANTTKQQFDFYATYTGVKIKDLLQAKSIDLTGATSLDILAPDGFAQSFTLEEINNPFPQHRFFSGFGVDDLSTDCAFVEYPVETYGYGYGDLITDQQWHLLAYQREDLSLEPASLDPFSGKINGEGPLRNILPPYDPDPDLNTPDRGKDANTAGCTLPEWDYDPAKAHNAFRMVKGAVIIRIQPMPVDCEEFDIINGGWAMVDAGEILIYGHGVSDL